MSGSTVDGRVVAAALALEAADTVMGNRFPASKEVRKLLSTPSPMLWMRKTEGRL